MTSTGKAMLVALSVVTAAGCANQSVTADSAPSVPAVSEVPATRPPGSAALPSGSRPAGVSPIAPGPGTTERTGVGPGGGGESEEPVTVPSSVAPGPAPAGAASDGVAAAAAGFVHLYWAPPPGLSFGQLADVLAPYATARLTDAYRDPARRDELVQPDRDRVATEISVQVLTVTDTTATVFARTVFGGGVEGRRVITRTLHLVADPAGVWQVDGFA